MKEIFYENLKKLTFAIDNFREIMNTDYSFHHVEETEYPDNPDEGLQKKNYEVEVSMNKDGRLKL